MYCTVLLMQHMANRYAYVPRNTYTHNTYHVYYMMCHHTSLSLPLRMQVLDKVSSTRSDTLITGCDASYSGALPVTIHYRFDRLRHVLFAYGIHYRLHIYIYIYMYIYIYVDMHTYIYIHISLSIYIYM